ncbi:MAG: cell division protein FtsA [Nitrospirae bacterium]|nr:cell division protein FtsA [Nitrospirota bacterium]
MITEKRKRNNNNIIVGLDVGTTKTCAIIGEVTDDGVNILAVSSQPSTGLKKGVVIDIEATAQSIKKAVTDVEEQAGTGVREVYVGIAGSHIKSFNSYGTAGMKGKEVTREDVDRAIDSASAVYVPLDREVLHILPTDFILDGQDGIKDPVGMAGIRLEVKVFIITGAVTSVQNLLKCCERAGLEVIDIVLQPLASSEATLTSYEREMGIALIDIGGGTTDIAAYKDEWLRHTAVLGIGGNHFTNDLSIGLRLPFHEAERVKKQYGTILPSEMNDMTEVDIVAIDGQVRGIPRKYISEILQPRGEELLDLIRQEMQMLHDNGIAVSGVVLTGGSSLLAGFDRMAEAVLSMPVRIGYPDLSPGGLSKGNFSGSASELQRINKLRGEFNNPVYATGIGLVLYGAESVVPAERTIFSSDVFSRIAGRMNGWFRKIVGSK